VALNVGIGHRDKERHLGSKIAVTDNMVLWGGSPKHAYPSFRTIIYGKLPEWSYTEEGWDWVWDIPIIKDKGAIIWPPIFRAFGNFGSRDFDITILLQK